MQLALREYETRRVELAPETFGFLASEHARHVELRHTGRAGTYDLKARQFVGTIVAPDLVLRIEPKCETRGLFYMLGHAYRLAQLRPEKIGQEQDEDLTRFVVELFLQQVEELLLQGLARSYVVQQDRLLAIRGKVLFAEACRSTLSRELTLPCEFEEFTEDVRENQVIRTVVELLCRSPLADLEQVLRLRRARRALSSVTPGRFLPAEIARFEYDRLSERYRPVHGLCRILLESCGLSQEVGAQATGAFLVDMNELFERFVLAFLQERVEPPLRVEGQVPGFLDVDRQVAIRPDICIYDGERLVLVVDTKYKNASDETHVNADVYQALAYCRAMGVRAAVLLHPEWHGPPRLLRVRDGENEVWLDGISIAGGRQEIEESLAAWLERIRVVP